jgi:hypothetical protein
MFSSVASVLGSMSTPKKKSGAATAALPPPTTTLQEQIITIVKSNREEYASGLQQRMANKNKLFALFDVQAAALDNQAAALDKQGDLLGKLVELEHAGVKQAQVQTDRLLEFLTAHEEVRTLERKSDPERLAYSPISPFLTFAACTPRSPLDRRSRLRGRRSRRGRRR